MGVLDRINKAARPARYSVDDWIQNYLIPSQHFSFGGQTYGYGGPIRTTYQAGKIQEINNTLPSYANAVRSCPPVFASQMVRALVVSQVRFIFRSLRSSESRRTFGTRDLELLEQPWPGATTGELVSRMEWHAGLAGNSYVYRRSSPRGKPELKVLRPDWVGILYGSEMEPDNYTGHALDSQVIAYVYQEGGVRADNTNRVHVLLPEDVAHWAPIPNPESPGIGESWITPAIREIQGDVAAAEHKLQFFRNGATPNLVISGIPTLNEDEFKRIVDLMEKGHAGIANAYKTLYLTAGADAKAIGSDFQQMEFSQVIGRGETRVSILSRVPAALLGISEGLQGSTLNQGNFGMARRMFADTWVHPTMQDMCAALAKLVNVPQDSELWFDARDIPLLREDAKDAALIQQTIAATISSYISSGFTPESAIAAATTQDPKQLVHSGLVSVQLWEPGQQPQTKTEGGATKSGDSPTEPSKQQGKSPGQPKPKEGEAPGKPKSNSKKKG